MQNPNDTLMEAARRLSRTRRGFTAADLMADPAVAAAFPSAARLSCQAQYLVGCAWLSVVAAHPVPVWALGPVWADPR